MRVDAAVALVASACGAFCALMLLVFEFSAVSLFTLARDTQSGRDISGARADYSSDAGYNEQRIHHFPSVESITHAKPITNVDPNITTEQ